MRACLSFLIIVSDFTRMGDRLLDSIALAAVASANNHTAPCTITWIRAYGKGKGKIPDNLDTLRIGDCDLQIGSTHDYDYKDYAATETAGDCEMHWGDVKNEGFGRLSPEAAYRQFKDSSAQHRNFLPPWFEEQHMVAAYKRVAATVRSALYPLERRSHELVGIHLRETDKVVALARPADHPFANFMTSALRNAQLMELMHAYVAQTLVAQHHAKHFFIASDSAGAREALAANLTSVGLVVAESDGTVLGDFFLLTQCSKILQVTRYSTFSMAASVVGDVPLVNFGNSDFHNGVRWWESVLHLDMPYAHSELWKQLLEQSESSS